VEPLTSIPVSAAGEWESKKMSAYRALREAEPSRVGEYRSQSARLREMARQTRFPDVRVRLLTLAASFDRLADRAEDWETMGANAAD
jgi:hypothetical protein